MGKSIVVAGFLTLVVASQISAQSAFMNHKQNGYVLSGDYTQVNDVSVYTLNAGKSIRGLTDIWGSFGWSNAGVGRSYTVAAGVTPYLSLDRRHKAPALGGIPLGLTVVSPPSGYDMQLIGTFGLEVDFPLYWAPGSRLVLVGQGLFNFQLSSETTERRTIGFLIGAEEGIRLTDKSMLLMGFAVTGREHTEETSVVFELGFIFPD